MNTPAKEYYALQTNLYSAFDEEGVPTHNAKGVEFKKEEKNKIKKEFKSHEDKYLKNKEKEEKDKSKAN